MQTCPAVFRRFSLIGLALAACFFLPIAATGAQAIQGPNGPQSAIDPLSSCLSCPGAIWSTITNVTNRDTLFATAQLSVSPQCFQGSCYYSRSLVTRKYRFSIPSTATINGIKADVWRKAGAGGAIADSIIQLMKNNAVVGVNNASAQTWPTANTMVSYGGPANLWGATWLPADVNDTGFGLLAKPINRSATAVQASLDYVQITIYYTTPSAVLSGTPSSASDAPALSVKAGHNGIHVSFAASRPAPCYSLGLFNAAGQCISGQVVYEVRPGVEFDKTFNTGTDGLYIIRIAWPGGTISKIVFVNK